ncbi:hypothetical protein PG988_010466 [Apiospora saccharicola]
MQFTAVIAIAFAAATAQAASFDLAPRKSKTLAGNPTVKITGTGVADVAVKPDQCGTVTPTGQKAQTVCVKTVTSTGFSATVKDVATGKVEKCNVTGLSGACGTAGAGATLSNLA